MDKIRFQLFHLGRKIYWFIVRPKTQGVKCVITSAGKILMLKRTLANAKWVFPGGAILPGETLEQAAIRKVKEDLGIVLSQVNPKGSFTMEILHRTETIHCFTAVVKELKIQKNDTRIAEARWFAASELPEPLSSVSQNVYDTVTKRD